MKPTQAVNIISKYIYKHIDGSYKFKISSRGCDVYSVVYYQVPEIPENPNDDIDYSDVNEMDLNLNFVTYQNAVRININELSPEETTIGYLKYDLSKYPNISDLKVQCLRDIRKKIINRYNKYQFIF